MKSVAAVAVVCVISVATVAIAGQVIAVRSNGEPVFVSVLSTEKLSAAEKEVLAAELIAHQTTRDPDVDAAGKQLPNPCPIPRIPGRTVVRCDDSILAAA